MSHILKLKALKGKEALDYLKQHKKALIAEKKATIKRSDVTISSSYFIEERDGGAIKAETTTPQEDNGKLHVMMVCNSTYIFDSHHDVSLPGSYTKTCKEKGKLIPHIIDHDHSVRAIVGDTIDTYPKSISKKRLGLNGAGELECLIQESYVMQDYDAKVYMLYKNRKVNQHSIALRYVKISLGVNNPEWKEEYAFWQKHYDRIENKEDVDKYGYFWGVEEQEVFENSGVLFGSNSITPVIETEGKAATQEQPSNDDTANEPTKKRINFGALANNKKNK